MWYRGPWGILSLVIAILLIVFLVLLISGHV